MLGQARLLYVEDDEEVREQMMVLLRRHFQAVDMAGNGWEGLVAFCRNRPDIVLTDFFMPLMNGLEMAQAIRELDLDIPILMATAHIGVERFDDAMYNCIDRLIAKPIDIEFLLSSFTSLLRKESQSPQ